MLYTLQLESFRFGNNTIELYVPETESMQAYYQKKKALDPATDFPYWARVWPAAWALTSFIAQHPQLVQNKKVLELAAGLGLPSLLSARYAKEVICSDYDRHAIDTVSLSAHHNKMGNINCRLIDWNHLPADLHADVILLSDINYEPAAFVQLKKMIQHFAAKGSHIILSTPQRLMAKPFIEDILPWCSRQHLVETGNKDWISVFEINSPPSAE